MPGAAVDGGIAAGLAVRSAADINRSGGDRHHGLGAVVRPAMSLGVLTRLYAESLLAGYGQPLKRHPREHVCMPNPVGATI